MSSKQRKASGWFGLPAKSPDGTASYTYETFMPLHALWCGYMRELLGTDSPTATQAQNQLHILPKLVKADFHGAVMTVVKAKCPHLVGLSGVVVKETENMFYVVTRGDKVKGTSHIRVGGVSMG